jgi:hypothetical protein
VTEPGPVERIPTKVVPFYVVGYDEETVPSGPDVEPTVGEEPEEPSRVPATLVGVLAFVSAVLMAALHVIGIVVASGSAYEAATVIAYAAIGFSVLAVAGGIAAVILRRGRGWGIAAIVIGVVANPVILLYLLRLVSQLQAG